MKTENYQLITILLITFVGFVGSSIAYPIFPPLFLHPTDGSIITSGWDASNRGILLGIALGSYPLGVFVGSPILGSCSDWYGRKPMLIISLAGSAFGYVMSAFSLEYNLLWPLIASRFITGMMEGNIALVRAMAADLEGVSKYKSFGRINSIAGIGYVAGPLIGGFFSDNKLSPLFSYALPFFLATLCMLITIILTSIYITDVYRKPDTTSVRIWKQFNLIRIFRRLFRNPTLKYLLIISSVFTFAVDIFYEMGPVYLTGEWMMTPAMIAIYNTILSLTLALGGGLLPYYLSRYYAVEHVVIVGITATAIFLGFLVCVSKVGVFVLFGLLGFSISVCTTNLTIQISDVASKTAQGEAMGSQLSLRMLGDAIVCLVGGFIIESSLSAPLVISSFIALSALLIYIVKFRKKVGVRT